MQGRTVVSSSLSYEQDPDRTRAVAASSRPKPATVIADRYELRDLIGSGTGGRVFEAYDRMLGRLVALKLMPVKDTKSPDAAERLRRFRFEAQAVSRLAHPNIITIHDFGQTQGFAWIVMQLVIGETLKEALRQQKRLPLQEAIRLIAALLSALDCAHGRGIVHGDVKPENILLEMSRTQDNGELRLSDFGVARMTGEEQVTVGEMVGTPSVMAPEQVRGEHGDARVDIWAAGVVFYEMLVGERPFTGSLPALFHNIQTLTPTPPSSLRVDLPSAFDAVITRALAKRPEDRFPTAQAMAEAVFAAQAQEGAVPASQITHLQTLSSATEQAYSTEAIDTDCGSFPERTQQESRVLLKGVLLGFAMAAFAVLVASQFWTVVER
jgi:serine/threonine-protein kinase